MAGKKEKAEAAERKETGAVPSFTLRADRMGHLQALLATQVVWPIMPAADLAEMQAKIREFELWMDAQGE